VIHYDNYVKASTQRQRNKKKLDRFMRNMTTDIYQVITIAQLSLHDGTVVVVIVL